jgi:hypothetical protein
MPPSIPGALNVDSLVGDEIVGIGVTGPRSAQTTTGAISALGFAFGNAYFVNESTGSDSNPGTRAAPFATLAAALAASTANHGDVVYLEGTVHVTATVAWNKNGVSLVGINAPSQNSRARISSSGSTVFTPMVNVTANGCAFIGLGTFYGYDDASTQICWAEAGGRNYYNNVLFGGGGNATAAAQAGMRSLTISGSGENVFVDCTFGLDTVVRATNANATLEFLGGVQRNKFIRPIFQMLSSLATNNHIKAAASAVDRSQYMFDAVFSNGVDSTGTTLNADILWDAAAGGNLILQGLPISVGATAVAVAGPVYVGQISAAGATTTGIGIKAT